MVWSFFSYYRGFFSFTFLFVLVHVQVNVLVLSFYKRIELHHNTTQHPSPSSTSGNPHEPTRKCTKTIEIQWWSFEEDLRRYFLRPHQRWPETADLNGIQVGLRNYHILTLVWILKLSYFYAQCIPAKCSAIIPLYYYTF